MQAHSAPYPTVGKSLPAYTYRQRLSEFGRHNFQIHWSPTCLHTASPNATPLLITTPIAVSPYLVLQVQTSPCLNQQHGHIQSSTPSLDTDGCMQRRHSSLP